MTVVAERLAVATGLLHRAARLHELLSAQHRRQQRLAARRRDLPADLAPVTEQYLVNLLGAGWTLHDPSGIDQSWVIDKEAPRISRDFDTWSARRQPRRASKHYAAHAQDH